MLKKDLCSTQTTASKIVAALQYKRCIALRECSAVNLMTSVTFSNEMRKILRPTHCPLSLQTQSCRCLVESSSCTYIQQLLSDTKDGFEDQTRLATQRQISTSFRPSDNSTLTKYFLNLSLETLSLKIDSYVQWSILLKGNTT